MKSITLMFKRITFSALLLLLSLATAYSQETWSLEKCVRYAQTNSLSIQQAGYSVSSAQLSQKESKNARLPTVNGFANGDLNFGRTIDPVTNQFGTETRVSHNIGIGANMTLYNGNRIKNTIKQSSWEVAAAKADQEQINNSTSLSIAFAYLQILFADEQLANAKKRLEQTQDQLEQTDKLIAAGTLPRADRLDILATIATNEQAIVTEENNVELSYLNLKQLMVFPPDKDFVVEKPTVIIPKNSNPEAYVLKEVYNKAYNTQPIIRAGEMRLKSSEVGIDLAKALRLPVITANANVNSFWSDKTRDFTNPNFGDIRVGSDQPVIINGSASTLAFFETDVTFPKRQYFGQISDNFGQGVGVSLSVPIYNGDRTDIAIERAQLGILNQKVINAQNEQQLQSDIQQAIANAKAAKKQFEAADKTVDALEQSYSNTEKKFKLGAINTFEYTSAKNTLDLAKVDLIIAKYNYLYTIKVIDFYRGEKITLK